MEAIPESAIQLNGDVEDENSADGNSESIGTVRLSEDIDMSMVEGDLRSLSQSTEPPTSPGSRMAQLYEKYSAQSMELERLEQQNNEYREQLLRRIKDRDELNELLKDFQKRAKEDQLTLNRRLTEAESQSKVLKDRQAASEAHYKKSIQDTHQKYADDMTKLCNQASSARSEMESAVLKYAAREADFIKLNASNEQLQATVAKQQKDIDALNIMLRGHKNEKYEKEKAVGEKEGENDDLRTEIDRLKTALQESDAKWIVANKQTEDAENLVKKAQLEVQEVEERWLKAREEGRQARRECIKWREEAESHQKSNKTIQQEANDDKELHRQLRHELDTLKSHHKETLLSHELSKETIRELEEIKEELIKSLASKTEETESLQAENERMKPFCTQVESANTRACQAENDRDEARRLQEDAEQEAVECRRQAESTLLTNEQLSQHNAQLSAQCVALEHQASSLTRQIEELLTELSSIKLRHSELEIEHGRLKAGTDAQVESLNAELHQSMHREQELKSSLDDECNKNTILLKKHNSVTKELKSELALLKRKVETLQAPRVTSEVHLPVREPMTDAKSFCSEQGHEKSEKNSSRASSSTSMDRGVTFDVPASAALENCTEKMIDKICKLQRQLARRSEKIEFLEEYARQMKEENKKKSRIIQNYAVREEVGALTTRAMDENKMNDMITEAELCKYGDSTMAAIFAANGSSAKMSSEMLIDINRKLQLVLEDALLKNITLKHSLKTMGEEIARLSRENRTIQMKNNSP